MNPFIEHLKPYPFERLNRLTRSIQPADDFPPISLAMGEPRHPAPDFLLDALSDRELLLTSLGKYPTTVGVEALRRAIADWCDRRYSLEGALCPEQQLLPLKGTREGLFSFTQAVMSKTPGSLMIIPNPFYQIYEGAALLAGATPYFLNDPGPDQSYAAVLKKVPEQVWQKCELMVVCNPGNPTGRVLSMEELHQLMELADRYDFLLASDECYAEIYLDEAHPPAGLLQACRTAGRSDFKRCLVFHSLSKRSNVPGLRSGFIAGDAEVMAHYLKYRTYHGGAMPIHAQTVSTLAWQDEVHVVENRRLYREKFHQVTPLLQQVLKVGMPDASFYLWAEVPGGDDEQFARDLYREKNVTLLPGSYLSREHNGVNPGQGFVRMALVAEPDQCLEAAHRLVDFLTR